MREQMIEIAADFPPTYDELFYKSMNEDDDDFPCYEVACETETQITFSNDGIDNPLTCDTADDTLVKEKTKAVKEIKNSNF